MKGKQRLGWKFLYRTAFEIADELKIRSAGTRMRIRTPVWVLPTSTDGWLTRIGDLGKDEASLQIWFDRFSGHADRKLCACFFSEDRPKILFVTDHVKRKLWPVQNFNNSDISTLDKYVRLVNPLGKPAFQHPVLEKYVGGTAFYGIYDSSQKTETFCARAVAFFEDVARSLPHATEADEKRDLYPQIENRQKVTSHLRRERSRFLANERKIRDKYVCQVCGFRFEQRYGKLGINFAEAHHIVPLAQLKENVKTHIEDLVTVCANCHRMLHHMEGKHEDVKKLRGIVGKLRGKKK